MHKKCKTERSINRQKQIEGVFLKLLTKSAYEDISVSEICETANVPRKSFYRYFDCKEGVLNSLIEHVLQNYPYFYNDNKPSTRTVINELKCYFEFWLKEPQATLIKVLSKQNMLSKLLFYSLQFPTNVMDLDKFFPNETPWYRTQILSFAVTGLMTLMFRWHENGAKESTLEMAQVACRILEKPLFPNLDDAGFLKE